MNPSRPPAAPFRRGSVVLEGRPPAPVCLEKHLPPHPRLTDVLVPRLPSAAALRYQEAERQEETGGEARQ